MNPTETRPVVATIAAVIKDHRILLIRRRNRPDAGRWAFPGGKIRWGESLFGAMRRELYEETGVRADPHEVFDAVDVYDYDDDGNLVQHFLLVAVLCDWSDGSPSGSDDALDAQWFDGERLRTADLARSFDVAAVANQALHLSCLTQKPE